MKLRRLAPWALAAAIAFATAPAPAQAISVDALKVEQGSTSIPLQVSEVAEGTHSLRVRIAFEGAVDGATMQFSPAATGAAVHTMSWTAAQNGGVADVVLSAGRNELTLTNSSLALGTLNVQTSGTNVAVKAVVERVETADANYTVNAPQLDAVPVDLVLNATAAQDPSTPTRDDLGSLIGQVGGVAQGNKSDAAYKALQDALAAAQKVLADPNASDEAVAAAHKALQEAYNTFNASPDVAGTTEKPGSTTEDPKKSEGAVIPGTGDDSALPIIGIVVAALILLVVAFILRKKRS